MNTLPNSYTTVSVKDAMEFAHLLKIETNQQHENLENSNLLKMLMSDSVNLETYVRYLRKMHSVIKTTEGIIFPKISSIIDTREKLKLELIESDISCLNYEFGNEKELTFKTFPLTPAFCLGAAYVVEGSTLGGKVILKHLKDKLGILNNQTNFLNCYGEHTGAKWREFMLQLGTYAVHTKTEKDVIHGASFTFDAIYEVFN